MAKKILMVTGDGAETLEVMYPWQRLREEGYDVIIAAPTKKRFRTVVHDFEPPCETYTEKWGYWVDAHAAFKEIDENKDFLLEKFVGLVIPGGRAPEWIRNNIDLEKIVRHFFDKKKPVAVICHGAQILLAYNLVKDRTITAYPVLARDFHNAGAEWVDKEVVVDGHLVSSRAWPDHPAWMREYIKILNKK
ncbi:MAG: peptidase [Planctomycetes bacterium RBG_16_59_8]|nr:MAG: peptidase [Planctomycetes bacterium RBG_16_59_8]